MTLTQIAFAVFAAIASGGLGLAAMVATKVRFPGFMGVAHGLGGLAALAVLFAVNLRGGDATPDLAWWALAAFLGGLVGGLLFFRVIFPSRAPLGLVAMHGSLGALGLYLLYRAAF